MSTSSRLRVPTIIQLSNNFNFVKSFVCWKQNKVDMKILDTLFKMKKRRFRGLKMCFTKNEIQVSIIVKMSIFYSFKASGSTFSCLHKRLLKSFKEAAISLRHLGKSILEGNLYICTFRNNIANPGVRNDI